MRFRRKRSDTPDEVVDEAPQDTPVEPADQERADQDRADQDRADEEPADQEPADQEPGIMPGPFDFDQVDVPDNVYVDLGSLLIQPFEDSELRMQVDEESGSVMALLLMTEEGALEVRAFAAPRNGDLWSETRVEIAADAAQRGGTADERTGPFGPELYCEVPVTLEDGQTGVQPSRVIGVNGPRWFLRATLLGQPAMEPEKAGEWEETIRAVVVRRGQTPLPPGEALPLTLPDSARRVD